MKYNLYTMKEGGVIYLDRQKKREVLRVPGGWIYTIFYENGIYPAANLSSYFIPLNYEFTETS